MNGTELFWSLVEPLYDDVAVTRSTMMGQPCVRYDGRFFAALEPRSEALVVKLPRDRVDELVAAGAAEPFAPAGRVFREWVQLRVPDATTWAALLEESCTFVAGAAS